MGLGIPRGSTTPEPVDSCRSPAPSWPVRRSLPGRTGRRRSSPARPGLPDGTSTSARSARPRRSGCSPVHAGRGRCCSSPCPTTSGPMGPTAGYPSDLGGEHPWLLRRRRHVLEGERASGRTARLACHQPQPARIRRSDPLDWHDVSIEMLANQITAVLHQVDAAPVVVLGHSMAGRSPSSSSTTTRAHPRADLPRRRQHAGLEAAARHRLHGGRTIRTEPRPPGRPGRRGRRRSPRPVHRPVVLHRAIRPARHAPQCPHGRPDVAHRQPADVHRPTQRGTRAGGPGDADPDRVGLLRPHHPHGGGGRVRRAARAPVQWVPGGHSWMLARPRARATSSPTSPRAGVHGPRRGSLAPAHGPSRRPAHRQRVGLSAARRRARISVRRRFGP